MNAVAHCAAEGPVHLMWNRVARGQSTAHPQPIKIAWSDGCDGGTSAYALDAAAVGQDGRACKQEQPASNATVGKHAIPPPTSKAAGGNGAKSVGLAENDKALRVGADTVNESDPLHPSMAVRHGSFGGVAPPMRVHSFSLPPRKVIVKRIVLAVCHFDSHGKGFSVYEQIRHVFDHAEIHVKVVDAHHESDLLAVARETSFDKYDALCVVGGDHSIHEAINGMMRRDDGRTIPIGMIPVGKSTSFSEDFGRPTPIEAAERIVAGMAQRVDVGRVSFMNRTTYALNIVSWPANYMRKAGSSDLARYKVPTSLDVLRGKFGRKILLDVDGETIEDVAMMIHIQNNQHVGPALRAAPMARVDDGLFDLVLVRGMRKAAFAGMLGGMEDGTWVFHDRVEYRRFRTLTLRMSDNPSFANVDGHIVGTEPLTIEVVPSAVEIFGPYDTAGGVLASTH
eukprot:Opistho-2@90724